MSIERANGSSSISRKSYSWMLCSTVIFVAIANFFLSVDAIRCHQCNSHVEEDCIGLRLNTPRAPVDDQFLKECEGDNPEKAFCRKTIFHIEVTDEFRIIRGCGYVNDRAERNSTCVEADNEGFKQMICSCFEDGCNSAPVLQRVNGYLGMSLASASVLLTSFLLRRFA